MTPRKTAVCSIDLLIKNGRVVDGSGQTAFYADVTVHAGQIVGVGKYHGAATRAINAAGRVVAPGFIDHHTHFDSQAMWDPIVHSTSLNGNTSIIVGQCGAVIVPVRPGDGDWYLRMFNSMEGVPLASQRAGVDFAWETIRNTWMPLSAGVVLTWGVCRALGSQTLCDG